MANIKISELDSASSANNTDELVANQAGTSRKVTRSQLLNVGVDTQAWDQGLDDISSLAVTDGNMIVGDGSNWVVESGATLRASIGVAIGTDVQAFDAGLADIAGLAVTDGNFIVGDGANWVAESGATVRTSLGLGTSDTPQFNGANFGTATALGAEAGSVTISTGDSGVTTPSAAADDLVIENNGAVGITLACPNTTTANIFVADTEAVNAGFLQYNHSVDRWSFGADATTRMYLELGLVVGSPTGGDAGSGSINAEEEVHSDFRLGVGNLQTDGSDAGTDINDDGRVNSSTNNSATQVRYSFYNPNGQVGTITTNGTSTAYNTTSDERLKTRIGDVDISVIDQISVHHFKWGTDNAEADGFFAQELHAVYPEAVSVGDDETDEDGRLVNPWGVDQSKLTPLLTAAVKDLRQRVAALEAA